MDYWGPKHVEPPSVMNKLNHKTLCILLDYTYIAGSLLNSWPTNTCLIVMVFYGCSSVIVAQHTKAVNLCLSDTFVEAMIVTVTSLAEKKTHLLTIQCSYSNSAQCVSPQYLQYNTIPILKYILMGNYAYVVGSKSFRPDQLFKVTEIKQLCYFST